MFIVLTNVLNNDVKLYLSGVRLNNQRFLRTPGPRTKQFKRFFVV